MKKTLALLLALVMAVGLTALPASAQGDDGFVFVDYDMEWTGVPPERLALYGVEDDGEGIRSEMWHRDDREVILLKKGGDSIPAGDVSKLGYSGSEGDIRVQFLVPGDTEFADTFNGDMMTPVFFSGEDIDGVVAVVDFHDWESHGCITYAGQNLVELDRHPYEFDFYEGIDDPAYENPIIRWRVRDPVTLSHIFLISNEGKTFIKNRVHFWADGIDTRSLDYRFGEDQNGREYIELWFNGSINGDGFFWAGFTARDDQGGEFDETVRIRVKNKQMGLRWAEGDWDQQGDPVFSEDFQSSLYWPVPQEYLGERARFIGIRAHDGMDYSDWLDPGQLMVNLDPTMVSDPANLELSYAAGLTALIPHGYGDFTIDYVDNTGRSFSMPVSIVPASWLSIQSVHGHAGSELTVPIRVGSEDLVCNSLSVEVNFDRFADVLTCTGVTMGIDEATGEAYDGQLAFYVDESGRVVVAWGNDSDVCFQGGSTFAELTFAVDANCPEGSYWLELRENHRNDGPFCGDQFENEVSLALDGSDIRIYTGTAGDLDGNGAVDDKDAMALLKWIAGYPDEETGIKAEMMGHRDITNDGTINLFDVTRLLQYIANWAVEIYY